jgi:hypothetical protein
MIRLGVLLLILTQSVYGRDFRVCEEALARLVYEHQRGALDRLKGDPVERAIYELGLKGKRLTRDESLSLDTWREAFENDVLDFLVDGASAERWKAFEA